MANLPIICICEEVPAGLLLAKPTVSKRYPLRKSDRGQNEAGMVSYVSVLTPALYPIFQQTRNETGSQTAARTVESKMRSKTEQLHI
jgi:hypothetical protein